MSYKGETVEYNLTLRDNQRSFRIRNDNDKIEVSAPSHSSEWEIELFIYKYIEKFIKMLNLRKQYIKFAIGNPGFVKIFDKEVAVKFTDAVESKNDLVFKLYPELEDTVKHMYKKLALLYSGEFKKRVDHWKAIMQLDFKNLSIKEMKRKWGVCYPQKSKIVLNIRLLHYPIECLDSVIIHELAHLVYPNHSKDFKYYVLKFCPKYKTYNELLKV
ncbi:zinc metalloprotease [Spiroplasma clarkii]|nr:zinc metalloprotease [Spiroplasma clarkii]